MLEVSFAPVPLDPYFAPIFCAVVDLDVSFTPLHPPKPTFFVSSFYQPATT